MNLFCPFESDYMESDEFKALIAGAKSCQISYALEKINKLDLIKNSFVDEISSSRKLVKNSVVKSVQRYN